MEVEEKEGNRGWGDAKGEVKADVEQLAGDVKEGEGGGGGGEDEGGRAVGGGSAGLVLPAEAGLLQSLELNGTPYEDALLAMLEGLRCVHAPLG